jgi:hypothetical protein
MDLPIHDINHLHKLFGHCGQETLNKMYGFKSSSNFDTCEQCAIAKARQENVNKNWLGSSNLAGERLYVDISLIKERSIGGAKDLDEEIYMETPKGLEIKDNKKLILRKTIYGLVQSARKFYEKIINVLKVIGFHGSKSDPCLWTLWDEIVNHMIIIRIYVNDCLIIGEEESFECLIDELKKHEFNLKVERNVNKYLSC